MKSFPFINQKTTDTEYSSLYQFAFPNNGILTKGEVEDSLQVAKVGTTLTVNNGRAVVQGFFCEVIGSETVENIGGRYVVIRVHQTAIEDKPRAELLNVQELKNEQEGDWDYPLADVLLSPIMDLRTNYWLKISDVPQEDKALPVNSVGTPQLKDYNVTQAKIPRYIHSRVYESDNEKRKYDVEYQRTPWVATMDINFSHKDALTKNEKILTIPAVCRPARRTTVLLSTTSGSNILRCDLTTAGELITNSTDTSSTNYRNFEGSVSYRCDAAYINGHN